MTIEYNNMDNIALFDFDEGPASEIFTPLELVSLGYTYIPRAKVTELRENLSHCILQDYENYFLYNRLAGTIRLPQFVQGSEETL